MLQLAFAVLALTGALWADPTVRICIYGDNRGSNRVHRAILRQAKKADVRLCVVNGDVLKYDYGTAGTPEAVLQDYRTVFGTVQNPLTLWPSTPGPNMVVVPGGHDEQYFADPESAEDSVHASRQDWEGTSGLGMKLYEAFNLEFMRLRVQPFVEVDHPLPMSPYGDYLLVIGSGMRRDCALLALYRSDRWAFREDQLDWVEAALTELREESPALPLIAVAHDWMWYYPDSLDDGHADGPSNGVMNEQAEADREQKRRLARLMTDYRVDVAVASDLHAYWAETDGPLLRINCGAAICTDPKGKQVAIDNLWLEYAQTVSGLKVTAHAIEPPVGCGLQPESAALYGTTFTKTRAAGAAWRSNLNP